MKIISLGNGVASMIDDEDFELVSKHRWRASSSGYAATTVVLDGRRTTLRMHRLLLGLEHGDPRQGDHINLDKLDNRRSNLRICTQGENNRNVLSRGVTGFKGVYRCIDRPHYRAQIRVNGKTKTLGYFPDPVSAHAAYVKAAKEHQGEYFCELAVDPLIEQERRNG